MATALASASSRPAAPRKVQPRPARAAEPPRLQAELDQLSQRYSSALEALAEAGRRAERAERRLCSRLVERAWPTTLCGFTGGFVAIVALRIAGF